MQNISLWQAGCAPGPDRPGLSGDLRADVLVIGGGLAGILIAHRLKQAGADCLVVEGSAIGSGTSGHTTAKITAQHRLIYDRLLRENGREQALAYYQANQRAIGAYQELAKSIDCDFEQRIAYVFGPDRRALEREGAAYRQLGIPDCWAEQTPLPLKTSAALGMRQQAQFHPLKMLYGLARELKILEDTYIREIEGNVAKGERGNIRAEHIVLATHFPLVNIPGLYFLKLYQSRSYVLALKGGPELDGMYVDAEDNGYSFRNYQDYLLLGGGGHKTGQAGGGYQNLRDLAARAYPGLETDYAWAAQDCMSLDSRPYIGQHRSSASQVYAVTGFNKWGMTGAMVAAMVIGDLIMEGKSEYERLFAPNRSMLKGQLLVNGGNAVFNLLRPGRRCSHMGCSLRWNDEEQSWDCPCHGSRFNRKGRVLNNPAKEGIDIE